MQDLDGTIFSHSGVALGDGVIASAHVGPLPAGGADLGGIRRDQFDCFWPHRDLYRIPIDDQAERDRIVAGVTAYRERAGAEGSFGFTKLFVVAAALQGSRTGEGPGGAEVLAAATAAANAWAANAERPRFYCAEFVATVLGRTFRVSELRAPSVVRGGGGVGIGLEDYLAALLNTVAEDLPHTPEEVSTRRALLAALGEHDRGFLWTAVTTIAASIPFAMGDGAGGDPPVPDPLPADIEPPSGLVLPNALVTPRILWQSLGHGRLQRVAQD